MNTIRDLQLEFSTARHALNEASRHLRQFDSVGVSSAQDALRSIQREQMRVLEQAAGLTNAVNSATKLSGVDEALSHVRNALNVSGAAQARQQALTSIAGLSSGITRQFKSDQGDWFGLRSIASGLIGLEPITESVTSAIAQLNATSALSIQGGLAAAQIAALNTVGSSYEEYFSGIVSQHRSLLESVGTFSRADKELAGKLGSILSSDNISFGNLNSDALKVLAGSKVDAFSSLNSVISSFASAIGNPAEYGTLVLASQSLAVSSRRMLDSVASSLASLSGQQAASNIASLVDFSAARALGAIANQVNTLRYRPEPMRRRRVRKSSKRQAELKAQLQELIAVSAASEHLVVSMQPLHQGIQQLIQKADAPIAICAAADQSRNSWKAELMLWLAILTLFAELAGLYKDYNPSQVTPIVTGYVTARDVNLRVGPATTQTVIMKLGLNQVVEIKQKQGTWCQVIVPSSEGTRIGWMHQRYIKAVEQDSVQ